MTLFDECIEALKKEGKVVVLSEIESKGIEKAFEETVPIHPTVAKVDFSKMLRKREIVVDEDILEELYKNHVDVNEPVYVFWDNIAYPTLKTSIKNVINAIADVISVSFDTWIFCPKERYIVEYYHEGETFLGFYSPGVIDRRSAPKSRRR
jgi:hypothetical protein